MAVEYDPVVEGSSPHRSRATSRNDSRAPLPSAGPADRILFLVNHKHRDLPSPALISQYLRARGRETRLSALRQEEEQIRSFDPGFIVLPKPVYDNARLLRWYGEWRQLIVIDTEGAPQDITCTTTWPIGSAASKRRTSLCHEVRVRGEQVVFAFHAALDWLGNGVERPVACSSKQLCS